MTTLTSPRPAVNNAAGKPEKALIAAAARRDLKVVQTPRWDVYVLNETERPEIRPVVVKLIASGLLVVAEPGAAESLVLPAGGVR